MSDVKKPMAGEWWEFTDGFRLFVVGRKLNGSLLCQTDCDAIEVYSVGGDEWKHLPDCTGWHWKPEVFPQYWSAMSEANAAFNRVDSPTEVWFVRTDGSERKWQREWTKMDANGGKYKRLTKEQAEALLDKTEVFPQYWTIIGTNIFTEHGFIRVDSPTKLSIVRKCGIEDVQNHSGLCRKRMLHEGRTELTKEQAEALLLPKESPDDWVIQDRVPYRPEFDQCRWDSDSPWLKYQDVPPTYRHGYESSGILRKVLQVRCKREDLPKPATTIAIIRWLCWNQVGKERLIHAAKRPNGFQNALNVGEEKFEVKP